MISTTKVYESFSATDTASIAASIATTAKPGDIICLSGPLGAGKTVFAQGFAQGLGCKNRVVSPTFTIMQIHEDGRLPLYHFDLYRLEGGEDELCGIGYEDYFYANGVSLVEWPEKAASAIPHTAIMIKMETDFDRDGDYRRIIVCTAT